MSTRGAQSGLGLIGGSGKGDKNRTNDSAAFDRNFEEIKFPHDDAGFEKVGGKKVKHYGPREPAKVFNTKIIVR